MSERSDPATREPRVTMAVARSYPYLGGLESHVAEVAPRLRACGYHTVVVSTDTAGQLPARDECAGVVTRRFRAWPRGRDYYASPGLLLHLLRADYDLLHVQGVHTLVPPAAMVAAALRRRPYVVTFHTGGSSSRLRSRGRPVQFRMLRPLLRRASALVAVSEFEARRFESTLGLRAGSIRVIRNGGALPPSTIGAERQADLVVSVGRLERYKGHHRAIAALAHLRRWRPTARLRILGTGPYQADLRRLAERLGVAAAISIGAVDPANRSAMTAELERASVSVLLSDYEAHPVAVMESLAAGTPAVVADNSGMAELVRRGWARGVRDVDSPQTVAAVVAEQLERPLVPDPASLPTWEACAAALDTTYREALAVPA